MNTPPPTVHFLYTITDNPVRHIAISSALVVVLEHDTRAELFAAIPDALDALAGSLSRREDFDDWVGAASDTDTRQRAMAAEAFRAKRLPPITITQVAQLEPDRP